MPCVAHLMLVMLRLTPFEAHLMLVMVLNMPEQCSFQDLLFHMLFMPKYPETYASRMDISLLIVTTGWIFDISLLCENSINQSIEQPSVVATVTELCSMPRAVLSTPESTIMPSNAFVRLSLWSKPVCSGVCVVESLVFSLGFAMELFNSQ